MKTKQEKIIVPSIEFYDMAIRRLTSSIASRERRINCNSFFAEKCKEVLKSFDDCYTDVDNHGEQKLTYISGLLEAKKAIKTLAEIQRIEKKMLAHYIQLKRELTDGVKACNNFVEEYDA